MCKKYYWLRLKTDFFQQKHIKKLRKMAGGDTYTIIYLQLLLMSIKNEGEIVFLGIEDDFASEIALDLGETTEDVQATLIFAEKYGLLELNSEDNLYMPEAISNIGKESESASRMRAFRERQKLKSSQCDKQVIKCDIEIEKEKRINKTTTISSVAEKEIIGFLEQVGLSKNKILELLQKYPLERLENNILFIKKQNKSNIKNFAGFVINCIKNNEQLNDFEKQKLRKKETLQTENKKLLEHEEIYEVQDPYFRKFLERNIDG